MKFICLFILVLTGWNSWGKEEFTCPGGQAYYEELKWDVQNYQEYSEEYKAIVHLSLFSCQMTYGEEDSNDVLFNLRKAARFGDIFSHFKWAEYLLTGVEGRYEAVRDRDQAILEFENTLKKINAISANYPNTRFRAIGEIAGQIYSQTLRHLIKELKDKYMDIGYAYYETADPAHYGNPTEAIERDQAHRNILNRLAYHINSCVEDHEGQHMQERAAKQWGDVKAIKDNLAAYNAFYLETKTEFCPHYKDLLAEIRKREATMHAIALNCASPSEQATEERPPCSDIKIETKEFMRFFNEEWQPVIEAMAEKIISS